MTALNNKTRIFLNSAVVSGVAILEKLFFFIINIIVARYLNVSDFGEYTTALGYATFFSTFVNIGINQTLVRAINLDPSGEREHLGNTLVIKTLLAIAIFICMTASLPFTAYNANTIHLTFIFGLVRIGNEYMTAFYALYEAKERFNVSSFFNFVFSLSFFSTTLLVVLYKGNYFHFAYTRLLIVLIIILLLAFYTFKDFKIRFIRSTIKDFIKSAIPFGLYSVFWFSLQRVNILVLSLLRGTVPVGYFNNGFIFLVTLTFIPANMNKVLIPFLYKISYEEEKRKYQFTFDIFSKLFGILSFYIFLMFFLFSETIITILYGNKYSQSIPILQTISFAIPFLFNIASTIITSLDYQRINTRIVGYALGLNLILNFLLIYLYGAVGAAMASVLTFTFIFLMSHWFIYKNKILSLRNVALVYIRLIIVSIIVYLLHHFFLSKLNWLITAMVDSVVFGALTLLFMIRENDVRILRETVFNKQIKKPAGPFT